jgi:hypothetical protein
MYIAMAKNITDKNFAREVKPQQLRQFLNRHTCKHDNTDLFHRYYVKKVFMQEPEDFLYYNLEVYSTEEIVGKINWIQKWTRAEHRTFAERFAAFASAELIFNTTNQCAIQAFEKGDIFPGLVEATKLTDKQDEVLEDFIALVHSELLIRPPPPSPSVKSPLTHTTANSSMPNRSPRTTTTLISTTSSLGSETIPTKSSAFSINLPTSTQKPCEKS